jgi:isopentenyl-diphosphate delta-isomerase
VSEETVVLVDEDDRVLGTMPKGDVHGRTTPLHRGFSCFVFHVDHKRLLIQQRSAKKKTWPLAWSNSCCGHPRPAESVLQAADRRLRHELGLEAVVLHQVASYRYCFTRDDVMENEICPIVVGTVAGEPVIDPDEVAAVSWIDWDAFLAEVAALPQRYSEWCVEETRILTRLEHWRPILGL